ncbi:phosphosulfolactate synthase [Methanococcus voltae]|uniref:Phosphosulfolactate synthase n=2 Tax=Methanococcus voltae TaxID=2188 RepID=A0A8J7UTU1_METVO|nr:phosphosulfolactate synthase [Methanococcus voltae]MBP2172403.1 phosphosulfolactate synthase [Methanococcus voltae]MBP2200641.1 phosphosulfolactate synthase [Methanococcus voltae]MCS3921366.1 phosphosulfolactate synthase [Methanococcus voltae PS]
MQSFSFLKIPVHNGLTMIIDKGQSPEYVEHSMKVFANYITCAKFGWGTSAVQSEEILKEKIEIYKKYGVKPYPGGTLFEYALKEGKFLEFLDYCNNLGFECVEISDGSMEIDFDLKCECIKKAKEYGFIVLSEIGKKSIEEDAKIPISKKIADLKLEIEAGSDFVILEGREGGKSIGLYDEKGNLKQDDLEQIVNSDIDFKKLIFEAPLKNQQVEFIERFGNSVNLGNIAFDDVISLETLRTGLRGDTFGKIPK